MILVDRPRSFSYRLLPGDVQAIPIGAYADRHNMVVLCWLLLALVAMPPLAGCVRPSRAAAPPSIPAACLPRRPDPSCFYKRIAGEHNTKVLVFVHGIFGGAATSWGDAETERFWPAMMATDKRFADFDIYLVNYPTPYLRDGPTVEDVATSELHRMSDLGLFSDYYDIHFIAHSMGGIVAKDMLMQLVERNEPRAFNRIRSVVFLATPAQGAELASLAAMLGNLQARSIEPASINDFIKRIENGWVRLLIRRDKASRTYPIAHCAYETEKTFGIIVVPLERANSRCDDVLQPMALNHHGVAVATAPDRDPYFWAMARIADANADTRKRLEAADLLKRADTFLEAGRDADARDAFLRVRSLYVDLKDSTGEAGALLGLANLDRKEGRPEAALQRYRDAMAVLKQRPEDEGPDADKAIREADIFRGIANLQRFFGRNRASLEAFNDALRIYTHLADGGSREARRGIAHVERGKGYLFLRTGRYDYARESFLRARSVYSDLESNRGLGVVLADLGDLEAELNRLGEAEQWYGLANDIYRNLDDAVGKANLLVGLGDLHRRQQKYEMSQSEYEAAIDLFRTQHDAVGEGNATLGLGDLAAARGRPAQARMKYDVAMNLYTKEDGRLGIANVLVSLGRLERNRDVELARQHLYQAAGIYAQLEMEPQRQRTLNEARNLSRR